LWRINRIVSCPQAPRGGGQGGQSIFVKYKALRTALRFHAEIQVEDGSKDFSCDLALLRVLGNKPSLDPFLRKDRLHADGLKVHDAYLEITDREFIEIRNFAV
jgi:hypothetical protein